MSHFALYIQGYKIGKGSQSLQQKPPYVSWVPTTNVLEGFNAWWSNYNMNSICQLFLYWFWIMGKPLTGGLYLSVCSTAYALPSPNEILPDLGVHGRRYVIQHELQARRVVRLLGRRVLHPLLAERLPQYGVQHRRPAFSWRLHLVHFVFTCDEAMQANRGELSV